MHAHVIHTRTRTHARTHYSEVYCVTKKIAALFDKFEKFENQEKRQISDCTPTKYVETLFRYQQRGNFVLYQYES